MNRRKVCVILVDRANYGRMRVVMSAIQQHPALELQVICAGSMVLERFGFAVKDVQNDGFPVDARVFMELEGSVPLSMAKSVGFGVIEFASELSRLQPDLVLLIGDRYEALAAALASAYTNIPMAHIQGGEISGSIDECARHAITKFAQWHFPATARAADYIYQMGESRENIFNVGCPVGDIILGLDDELPEDIFHAGSGADIRASDSFFLVIFHPVTTEFGRERDEVRHLIGALDELKHPTVFLWPNIDAGADHISKELRIFRDQRAPGWLRFMTNLVPLDFQKILKRARVAIGNSSSFVRDSTFMGTPVVLVGDRQKGRETGRNACTVPAEKSAIRDAIARQMAHGRYPADTLYGNGTSAIQIAQRLSELNLFVQKRLDYPLRMERLP